MSYNEVRDSVRDSLELQYMIAKESKNIEGVFSILQKLMRYRLIDFSDERVSKAALKRFEKKVSAQADAYDYRHSDYRYMIADNLIGKDPAYVPIKVHSEPHWIKRRELQYVGDQMCEAKDVMFRGVRLNMDSVAQKALQSMAEIYEKSEHKKLDTDKYQWKDGEYHVWAIRRDSAYAWNTDYLGYYVTWFNDAETVNVELVVDTEGMAEGYIDIIRQTNNIIADIEDAYKEAGVKTVNIKCLTSFEKIGKKQRDNKEILLSYEEKMKALQDEADMEAIKNEAYNRRMTVEQVMVERAEKERLEAEAERKADTKE